MWCRTTGSAPSTKSKAAKTAAQMAAVALWQDYGLIFASEVGTPMDPDNFSHSFARLCERAGLVTGIRTSCATREPR